MLKGFLAIVGAGFLGYHAFKWYGDYRVATYEEDSKLRDLEL